MGGGGGGGGGGVGDILAGWWISQGQPSSA